MNININEKYTKNDIYYKIGLLKFFQEKFDNNFILESTKKYRIIHFDNRNSRKFMCIFYQNDTDIGIKCAIFIDKMKSEFIVIFERYENAGEDIINFDCQQLDVNIIEQLLFMNSNEIESVKQGDETNKIPKINISNLSKIFTSKVMISLYTKLNELYALYSKNPITFLGYDISGCYMSLFCYLYYKKHKDRFANLITFGTPRYGNLEFKQEYESLSNFTHYNVINKNDKIIAYPFLSYHHVGNIVILDEDNTIKTLDSYSRIEYLWRVSIFKCNNTQHHNINSYILSIIRNNELNNEEINNQNYVNYDDPYVELDGDYLGN